MHAPRGVADVKVWARGGPKLLHLRSLRLKFTGTQPLVMPKSQEPRLQDMVAATAPAPSSVSWLLQQYRARQAPRCFETLPLSSGPVESQLLRGRWHVDALPAAW